MKISIAGALTALSATLVLPISANASYSAHTDYLLAPDAESIPVNCSFGRSKTGSKEDVEVTLEQVQEAYNAAVDLADYGSQSIPENAENAKAVYDLWESIATLHGNYDYLRLEGPSYVLQGQPFRFKANTLDMFANVSFYTNESGYVGADKSDYEANAYHHLRFDKEHGAGVVWADRSDMCSAMGVWVQKAPEVEFKVKDGSSYFEVKYYVDNLYSKAVREGQDIEITFTQAGLIMPGVFPAIGMNKVVSPNRRNVRIQKSSDGRYYATAEIWYPSYYFDKYQTITATISDGTFTASDTFKARR